MRMKLFHASNQPHIGQLETVVNGWLAALPAPTEIFAVNTASSIRDAENVPTLTITVWYYDQPT
jgi:hypothetical protein